jgi:hypothetical protein
VNQEECRPLPALHAVNGGAASGKVKPLETFEECLGPRGKFRSLYGSNVINGMNHGNLSQRFD